MSNPWFRLHADVLSDEKVLSLAFSDRWFFVAVMCLKCEGMQDKYEGKNLDRKMAIRMGISLSEAEELKGRLVDEGLICGNWIPVAWDKRQYKSDTSAERVARHRAKQKQSLSGVKRPCNVTVTPPDTDTDTENKYSRFDEFWDCFADKRGKEAARRVWNWKKLDDIADQVINGARRYVASRGSDRKFWKQAQGWLNDGRWEDEPDQPISKPVPPDRKTVFVEAGTPEWSAWRAHDETIKPIQSQHGYGRWLPSKLPPQHSEARE
jgi:hypothetical protein